MHSQATRILRNGRSPGRDLRDASPAAAGAGKIYPVNPKALKLFREIMAEKLAGEERPPVKPSPQPKRWNFTTRKDRMTDVDLTKPLDPNEHYPQDVIRAAQITKTRLATGDLIRANLSEIFTDAVVERWRELKQANPQMTNDWLAANNGRPHHVPLPRHRPTISCPVPQQFREASCHRLLPL